MSLSVASAETTLGNIWHSVVAGAAKVEAAVQSVVSEVDKAAPVIEAVVTAINPAAGAATTTVISLVDAVDAAVTAGGTAVQGGMTVQLPAELVAAFISAKAAILADIKKL